MPVNHSLAIDQWERYRYCRDSGHLDFVKKADMCEDFFAGQQWSAEDLQRLRNQRRPAMTINKIISTVGTILGEQIQNRTEVLFRPKNGSPAEIADVLTKTWMYVSQQNQLPWVRSDVFCDGIVRSRGFYDVRMQFTDSMKGEVEVSQLNSKNVVIDPDGEEYDPDKWNDCFTTKWMSPMDIAILYNEDDAKQLGTVADSMFMYGYDSVDLKRDRFGGSVVRETNFPGENSKDQRRFIRVLDRQYRKLDKQMHFVDIETGDMRPIPEHWDRNKIALLLQKTGGRINTTKKLVKRIRWTVTADSLVLHDEWSPYKHLTVVPYFPYFRYGTTVGVVENLISPQEILNKVSSQELHVVNTTANSGWMIEQNSLINMSIEELENKGAQTGLVLEYAKNAQPPVKIAPNQTPSGMDRISYKAEEHIKSISNVSDSMQGFDREDVAAKAIQYKTQRGSVNMTKVIDNLGRTDYILARNVLDLIQTYYTEERILNITHDNLLREPEAITVNQLTPEGEIVNDLTIGEYDITITSTPHRDSIEDSQFEQARALKELGIAIPDEFMIENSRLIRRGDLIKAIQAQSQTPEAQQQAQLQMAGMEAEVGNKQADIQLKGAKTQTEMAKAAASDPAVEQEKAAVEVQLKREEHQMDMEKAVMDMQMKMKEIEMKLQAQSEEHQLNMAVKQQEAAQNAQIREEDAAAKRAQMLRGDAESDNSSQSPNPTT